MKYSRTISIILAVIMTLLSITSCASNAPDSESTDTSATATTEAAAPEFVEADFGGAEFKILTTFFIGYENSDKYLDGDESLGTEVNKAIEDRNRAVEEKYGVTVTVEAKGTKEQQSDAKSGTVEHSLIMGSGALLVRDAIKGELYDFTKLPNVHPERSYWMPGTHENLTIAGKMLIFTGDISMNSVECVDAQIFNKKIVEEMDAVSPYEHMANNTWNMDTFLTMVTDAGQENGDYIWDVNDRYGHLNSSSSLQINSYYSAGFTGTEKNEDGSYRVNILDEESLNLVTVVFNKFLNYDAYAGNHGLFEFGSDLAGFEDYQIVQDKMFAFYRQGNVLFMSGSLADMDGEKACNFGIVPNPKVTEDQAEYYCYIDTIAPMFAVPRNAENLEMVGAVLDYMAYKSEQLLFPAYLNEATDFLSDDESSKDEEMIRLIHSSSRYLWSLLYANAFEDDNGHPWDPCGSILNEIFSTGNPISPKKRIEPAEKSINDLYRLILEMDTAN